MPNSNEWLEPALAFRLQDGRPVFHCYNDDNANDRMEHHFTLSCTAEDEESMEFVFDWRDLLSKFPWGDASDVKLPEGQQYDSHLAVVMCVVQRAYAAGMLKVPE